MAKSLIPAIDTAAMEAEVAALRARLEANDKHAPSTTITRGQVRAVVASHLVKADDALLEQVTDQLYDHEQTVATEKRFADEREKAKAAQEAK